MARACGGVLAALMLSCVPLLAWCQTPDYSKPTTWVCRPGNDEICTTGLDALAVYADGHTAPQPFAPAAHPDIDCFYVYPTVSREQTAFSDLDDSPEIQRAVKSQVGRLSSRCRVFAPLYRQATLLHLRQRLLGMQQDRVNADTSTNVSPAADVEAAWHYYLDHDNRGRGVVLIGHSQGTILLQALIAKSIDGTPAQRLLVAAFLPGNPSLGVPKGAVVGGTFKHIPICSAANQIGCAYAWGSYFADDDSPHRLFGRARGDGLETACVNPAAPGGGSGSLKFYYMKGETASPDDPPWVESVGQLTGACRADAAGNVFRVTVEPGARADELKALLSKTWLVGGWGLHSRDVNLVQGNLLDVMDAEIAAWKKQH